MRTIKFRAWDKQTKKMVPLWGITWKAWDRHIDGGGTINDVIIDLAGTISRFEHEVVLMQFTGLTDKNGKEIYEGDILRKEYLNGIRLYVVKYGIGYMDCKCYSYMGIFLEVSGKQIEDTDIPGTVADCEIIGNIYENKELLP